MVRSHISRTFSIPSHLRSREVLSPSCSCAAGRRGWSLFLYRRRAFQRLQPHWDRTLRIGRKNNPHSLSRRKDLVRAWRREDRAFSKMLDRVSVFIVASDAMRNSCERLFGLSSLPGEDFHSAFFILSTASFVLATGTVSANLTYPSPGAPKPLPGVPRTPTFSSK